MIRFALLPIVLCVLTAASPPAAHAKEKTPPGSFLKYRAGTVRELVEQVSSDPTVRARYAKHFGASPDRIASSLGQGLKLVSLTRPAKVRTWYVDKKGRAVAKTKLLPRGTLVFVGSDGKPLLAWSCGNPLRAELPQQVAKKQKPAPPEKKQELSPDSVAGSGTTEEETPTSLAAKQSGEEQIETKVLAQPVETIGTEPIASIPELIPVEAAEPIMMAQLPVVAGPVIGAVAPAVSAGAGMSALYALGGLAGALGGFAALSGDSDDSDPSPPVVPPVPEPTGLTVLATGALMGLSAARITHRRRRR